ncbi:L-arabinose isomerase [Aquimarina celericrescens]|uniref:L-arabinose isomerase n=1 Tax=Aquimarina celericrescens TaxID=1964542 RepID=A0ABW5B1J1_9FLAO|nr:L-arabinose isomerase [Aquimarina celericrescens]
MLLENTNDLEVWWVTGSQHLYGPEVLNNVAEHTQIIVSFLNNLNKLPLRIFSTGVVASSEEIHQICDKANSSKKCIGVIFWMHTFSPAKMWIRGLKELQKPILHFHTQFNAKIPWETIDMDFMNENQSAHGGREFGFMMSRMKKDRKIVVGHWKDNKIHDKLCDWCNVVVGYHALKHAKVARIGDNMREVAVTEGDKVAAQFKFGFTVEGYGIGDLVEHINEVSSQDVRYLIEQYQKEYHFDIDIQKHTSVTEAAKIELGLRQFLKVVNATAFTTTFENLHGMNQLPGISVQRLMKEGYGFGAEGDWKTAALLYALKTMSVGLEGGTSFMEDYTYHFDSDQSLVLGSHMLEVCPSIAAKKPFCEVHPLSIGGKANPARLVFDVGEGAAINVSLIDLGNRFRMICNEVDIINPPKNLPKLPTARALWKPKPNFETAIEAWIYAGGAHHTVFSKALKTTHIVDLCEMLDIELIIIDNATGLSSLKNQLKTNEVFYQNRLNLS